MRQPVRPLAAVIFAALLVSCGGPSDEFVDAMPNFQTVALDLSSADTQSQTQALSLDCHPHLFHRTREAVRLLNRQLYRLFGRLDAIVDRTPDRGAGDVRVWEREGADAVVKLTVKKTSDDQFEFDVQLKPKDAPNTSYLPVASGRMAKAAEPHAGNGVVHLNLDALTRLFPEELAEGSIDLFYDVSGEQKKLVVRTVNFTPDRDDMLPPLDGNYVFARTAGAGGSLKFQERVVLQCPYNLDGSAAKVRTVARWKSEGEQILGRADAQATGAQIGATSVWLGLTCFDASRADDSAELYWQMKLEGTDGIVLKGDATVNATDPNASPATCDTDFGPLPSMTTNAGDYDFGAINFEDDSVVPYPGQPAQ